MARNTSGRLPSRRPVASAPSSRTTIGPTRFCTRIGRDWLVPDIGSQTKALAYGDEAWTRVTEDWTKWREEGLTEHRNWWPEIYRAACRHWAMDPDPKILAYNT